jgi:hypothetical protein
VEVHDVEAGGILEDEIHQAHVVGQRLQATLVTPQSPGTGGDQLGFRLSMNIGQKRFAPWAPYFFWFLTRTCGKPLRLLWK